MTRSSWTCAYAVLAVIVCGAEPVHGATLYVAAGGDLQATLNTAQPGDTILLAEGAEFVGNFVLPVKTGTGWITVRSAAPDTTLPPNGVRINPSHAPRLARLRSLNSSAALRTAPGAHHWVLRYLEFAGNPNGFGDILQLGDGSTAQNTLDKVPQHLVLNHLYVHGDVAVGQKRCIALNAAHVTIADSYVAECKTVGQDSQAIGGWNGPGPYLIENNYLEGAGENFMLGGSDPAIPNLVADGVTFRRNYVSRPMSWRNPIISTPQRVTAAAQSGGSLVAGVYAYRVVARRTVGQNVWGRSTASAEAAVSVAATTGSAVRVQWEAVAGATEYRVYGRSSGAQNIYWRVTTNELLDTGAAGTTENVPTSVGTRWSVKNVFELKNARNVTVENNIFENHWQESQPGYSIVFTPRNSGGTCTWCVVENVRFEYNIVRNVAAGFNLLGHDSPEVTRQTRNIAVRHNLFTRMTTALGGNAYFMLIGDAPRDVVIEHNTVDSNGSTVVYVYGGSSTTPATVEGFRMVANAAKHGSYGMGGASYSYGNEVLSAYYPAAVFTADYLAGGSSSRYPAGNLFAGVFADQFVAASSGDYTVRAGSLLDGAAPDGTDVGADFPVLALRVAGVETGFPADDPALTPPTARFATACTYLTCTFTDASVAGSPVISSYAWQFGDGSTASGQAVTHSFAAAAIYQVTLSVRDAAGLSASAVEMVTVVARTFPDLVVAALTGPGTGTAGGTIQVTDTTRNIGDGSATSTRTLFFLSADAVLDAADRPLGARSVAALAAGAESSSATALSLPTDLQSGGYFVLAHADGDRVLGESNESNNVASLALTVAVAATGSSDLTVSAFTAPAAAAAGTPIIVSETTSNLGSGPAPASATQFFLSPNMFLDSTDTPLQARSVSALAASATSTASTTVTIPASTRSGTYYLIAQADAGRSVAEGNELNNTRWTLVQVGPDLGVSALSAPTRAVPGGTLAITETTRNTGAGPAGASSTAFYLSANTTFEATDIKLQPARGVPALAANASSMATTTVAIPVVAAGTWYIIAAADDAKTVDEVYETNNVRVATVFIGPDLTISSVVLPVSATSGGSMSVSTTVRNGSSTQAGASVVRFYLSRDLALDAADVAFAAAQSVPALQPDASAMGTTTLALPVMTPGSYYLLSVADGNQAVSESIELNNTVVRPLQIVAQ